MGVIYKENSNKQKERQGKKVVETGCELICKVCVCVYVCNNNKLKEEAHEMDEKKNTS